MARKRLAPLQPQQLRGLEIERRQQRGVLTYARCGHGVPGELGLVLLLRPSPSSQGIPILPDFVGTGAHSRAIRAPVSVRIRNAM